MMNYYDVDVIPYKHILIFDYSFIFIISFLPSFVILNQLLPLPYAYTQTWQKETKCIVVNFIRIYANTYHYILYCPKIVKFLKRLLSLNKMFTFTINLLLFYKLVKYTIRFSKKYLCSLILKVKANIRQSGLTF